MSGIFSARGAHARPRGADRDELPAARVPEAPAAGLPRRNPGGTLVAVTEQPAQRMPVPDSLRAALYDPERPGPDVLRRVLQDLRDQPAPEAVPATPAAAGPVAVTAAQPVLTSRGRKPEPRPPAGMPVLIGIGGRAPNAAVGLDGMPERKTIDEKPVIRLGFDSHREGESYALGLMPDAYLDALITVLLEERRARQAATDTGTGSRPAFTPRAQEGR